MERVSRRNFMAGAGVAAGGSMAGALALGESRPSAAQSSHDNHSDEVAERYCAGGRRIFLDKNGGPIADPHTALFLYGLICADLHNRDNAPEALLPADDGRHEAWFYSSAPTSDSTGTEVGTSGVRKWPLKRKWVTFVPLSANGQTLNASGKGVEKVNRRKRHPWVEFDGARDLGSHAGSLIADSKRSQAAHVKGRVSLHGAQVEAALPYSLLGRWGEWAATKANGSTETSATTDTILTVRRWPADTRKLKVTFTDMDNGSAKTIVFDLNDGADHKAPFQALFAVTHAVPDGIEEADLKHTMFFANLVEGGDPNKYKVPPLERGCYGEDPNSDAFKSMIDSIKSSKDGHCEISYDG